MIRNSIAGHRAVILSITTLILALFIQSCAGPHTLRKNGLSFIQIGDSMPTAGTDQLNGHSLSSSVMEEEDYTWRVSKIDYGDGEVVIESDFQKMVLVNRIRVETPAFKTKGGLKVGDPLRDLLKCTSKWNPRIYAKYKLIELTSAKFPRTVFLLRQEGFDYSDEEGEVTMSDLDAESLVVGIVIF